MDDLSYEIPEMLERLKHRLCLAAVLMAAALAFALLDRMF